jgi:hypothetical protein
LRGRFVSSKGDGVTVCHDCRHRRWSQQRKCFSRNWEFRYLPIGPAEVSRCALQLGRELRKCTRSCYVCARVATGLAGQLGHTFPARSIRPLKYFGIAESTACCFIRIRAAHCGLLTTSSLRTATATSASASLTPTGTFFSGGGLPRRRFISL